jgi:putative ABC transport system substrate-binding protein
MAIHIRRREFIFTLGGAAAAWPLAARAQQPAMPVIGFLNYPAPASPETNRGEAAEFRRGLKEAGYVEGQNVAIEFRLTNTQSALPALAADLVRRQVAVIVAAGASPTVLAAKAATSTIPIVFSGGADPVKYGLAASLNRPGGNVTGMTLVHNQLAGKRLDLLHKLLPQATTVAYLASNQQNEAEQEIWNVAASAISSRPSQPLPNAGPARSSSVLFHLPSPIAVRSWRWRRTTRSRRYIRNPRMPTAAA